MKKNAVILIIVGFVFIVFGFIINNINSIQKEKQIQIAENIKNQEKYNEFIENKFSSKYFKVSKIEELNTRLTNLRIEYDIKGKSGEFYLKTEWIKENNNEFIILTNYKSFLQNNSELSFVVVGIAGKRDEPELLYIIPVNEINTDKIYFDKIEQFKKHKINSSFFFDVQTKLLK